MKRGVAGIGVFVLLFVFQPMPVRSSVVRAAEIESAGTVPFIFDDNRVFAELTFVRPDGGTSKSRRVCGFGNAANGDRPEVTRRTPT